MASLASRTRPASYNACRAVETVGFESPRRRAISAREIGCPRRIPSSTARSFIRWSSFAFAAWLATSEFSTTTPGGSGNADVVMRGRLLALIVAERVLSDGRDDRPVAAHRAVLEPPPAEPERLRRSAGNPDRREEVTPPAAHYEVAAQATAAKHRGRGFEQHGSDQNDNTATPAVHPTQSRCVR